MITIKKNVGPDNAEVSIKSGGVFVMASDVKERDGEIWIMSDTKLIGLINNDKEIKWLDGMNADSVVYSKTIPEGWLE